jgi:hypothetical protein
MLNLPLFFTVSDWMNFECMTTSTLVPDFEEGVPGPGADCHPVLCDAQAGHAIVVAGQHACAHTAGGVIEYIHSERSDSTFRTKKKEKVSRRGISQYSNVHKICHNFFLSALVINLTSYFNY